MRNLKRITAYTYKLEILETVKKWRDSSDNEELANLAHRLVQLTGYISALEMAEDAFDDAIDAANAEAFKHKEENWRLRKEITELKEKLKTYEL